MTQVRAAGSSPAPLAAGAVVVVVLVTAVHWPALSASALSFDDSEYFTENPLVRSPSWHSAGRFLGEVFRPSTVHGYYQPLTMISLMLDYAMGARPDNLRPLHRTSLLLHLLNTVLCIVLVYLLFKSPWSAVLVGLLFGVHPMTVETIAWVGERKTLLAAFFASLSLIAYVRYARSRRWSTYGACLLAFVLALMCKPTSTPLPVCMLLLDFWPLRRLNKRAFLEKVPLFVIAGISAYITYRSQALTAETRLGTVFGPGRIPYILCHNIIFYLRQIACPINLSSHYPFPSPLDLSNAKVLAGVIGTLVLIPALILSLRWTRALLTGWLYFFIALFPAIGVVGFSNVIAADKFAYLPSAGLILPIAYFLVRLRGPARRPGAAIRTTAATVVVAILAATAAAGARSYLHRWQSTERLFRYMLAQSPQAPAVRLLLARELARQGRTDEAITHYRKVIEIVPAYEAPYNDLGVLLFQQGDTEAALELYSTALQLEPEYAEAHNNLGNALLRQGHTEKAAACYARALEIKPDYADAHYNLANLLAAQHNPERAMFHYKQAIGADRNHASAHSGLGNMLWLAGDHPAAISQYRKALEINPDHAFSHRNLAELLHRQGRIAAAVGHYREALRCKPDWWEVADVLAFIHATHEDGRFRDPTEAVRLAEQACRITGRANPAVLGTLALAYAAAGRLDRARSTAQEAIDRARSAGQPQVADDVRARVQRYLGPGLSQPARRSDNP